MEIICNNKKINIIECNSFISKLKGFMFIKKRIDFGIRINRCNAIHTFFMKQNIDVCITNKNNQIIYLKNNLGKNKIIGPIKNGYYTYELPLNSTKSLKISEFFN